MYLCLSSGSRPRYRRDISRALALPRGAQLQFRYRRRWIAAPILESLDDPKRRKKLRGASVLVAYIDQTSKTAEPQIVPCRLATLADSVLLGRSASLQLTVTDFALAADLASTNQAMRSPPVTDLPHRVGNEFEGLYWLDVADVPGLAFSSDVGMFEEIVQQLAPLPDFEDDRFFYTVQGLVETGDDAELPVKDNTLELRPNRDYDLRLYHYHPTEGDPGSTLGATVSGTSVSFTMTPDLVLDSPYDVKRFRFRTDSSISGDRGVFTLRQKRESDEEWQWDFDLPFHLKRAFTRRVGLAVLIAVFLAIPPITSAFSNNPRIVIPASAIFGLAAGLSAAFGIQRSL